MLLPPEILVRDDASLTAAWRSLRGGLRFAEAVLWVLRIDPGGRPGPLVTFTDLPEGPYDVDPEELRILLAEVFSAGSTALLYGRPGSGAWTVSDRAWVRFLAHAAPTGDRAWSPHAAHDAALVAWPDAASSEATAAQAR